MCVRDYSFFTIYGYDLIKEGVLYKVLPLLTEHSGLNPVEIIISNHLINLKISKLTLKVSSKKKLTKVNCNMKVGRWHFDILSLVLRSLKS